MTVFLHLENNSYSIFDGMLMNPHVSPYTARTNLALRAIVDLLLQQAAFKQTSTVPAPLDFAILANALPPSPILPVADSSAPALAVNISTAAAPASAAQIPAVPSLPLTSPGVRSNSLSVPGSPYTFQTCPPTMLSQADPSWAALGAGSRMFNQTPTSPTVFMPFVRNDLLPWLQFFLQLLKDQHGLHIMPIQIRLFLSMT